VKYRVIERCRDSFPVRMMCRCLAVSASGFYDWRERQPGPRAIANQALSERIGELHDGSDGVLGAPRMHDELGFEGWSCGQNRVARLMRLLGRKGVPQKKAWRKKPSGNRPEGVENHLERAFHAEAPNLKWVTDITYISTMEGWLYLCVVLDLHLKDIVGWSMSAMQDRQLVLQAVLMAVWQREDNAPVVLHSDRGTQFTSGEYARFLKGHNLICSMSAVGSCADNAACEGFFGMLKRERVNRKRYRTRAEARADIFDYIERWHNPRKRRVRTMSEMADQPLTEVSVEMG
jgi:putative transposase